MGVAYYAIHPLAAKIPDATEGEYIRLRDDIRENGQREPIVLDEGMILDGRHRHRACLELGIMPKVRQYNPATDGESRVAFVLSMNLHRRHLNPSQQAMVGAEMLPAFQAEAKERQRAAGGSHIFRDRRSTVVEFDKSAPSEPEQSAARRVRGDSREQVAALVGVSSHTVYQAKKVIDSDPRLAEKVRTGEMTVNRAATIIARREQPENTEQRKPQSKRKLPTPGGRPTYEGWKALREFLLDELLPFVEEHSSGHADKLRKLIEWVSA